MSGLREVSTQLQHSIALLTCLQLCCVSITFRSGEDESENNRSEKNMTEREYRESSGMRETLEEERGGRVERVEVEKK